MQLLHGQSGGGGEGGTSLQYVTHEEEKLTCTS